MFFTLKYLILVILKTHAKFNGFKPVKLTEKIKGKYNYLL
jgi:hypothetical protein